MENLKSLQLKCPRHEDREIRYFCLDNACTKNCCLCILCLKHDHEKCKNDFIIAKSQFESKTQFLASDLVKIQILKNTVKDIVDEMRVYTTYKIKALLANKAKKFKEIHFDDLKSWRNIELVKYLKANFSSNISATSMEFSSNYNCTPRELFKSIQVYFKELDFVIAQFSESLASVAVLNSSILKAQNFISHEHILVHQVKNYVEFTRVPGSTSNYCISILDLPVHEALFKVTVLNVNSSDRFLDMGFLDKPKYDSVTTTNKMTSSFYSGGSYSFCGYSFSKLTGTTPTSSSSSPKGHEEGKQYFVQISRKDAQISIYNQNKEVDLVANEVPFNTAYYFYVVLYHEESSCRVSLISPTK